MCTSKILHIHIAYIQLYYAGQVSALDVYFPEGASFTHFYSGKAYTGGTTSRVPTPFDELAIFKVQR